jgi:hypothetical protein
LRWMMSRQDRDGAGPLCVVEHWQGPG